jgi:hypothetical protein
MVPRFSVQILLIGEHLGIRIACQTTAAPKATAGGSGMNITQRDRDLGTGYAMMPSTTRTELASVGRGTPMGELLRHYRHPVGLVSDATDIPRKLRALGEDPDDGFARTTARCFTG